MEQERGPGFAQGLRLQRRDPPEKNTARDGGGEKCSGGEALVSSSGPGASRGSSHLFWGFLFPSITYRYILWASI